ncbi:MAG: DUF4159 domain-containing protein [Gemmatimonadetes bacterium]|nr:DUF4159 domain-containing protein [Gemmatimonadota bacterium]
MTRITMLAVSVAMALAMVPVLPSTASAQRGGGRERFVEPEDNPRYDGRFTFVRVRYEMGLNSEFGFRGRGGGGLPPWAHDYPRGERNFTQILSELATVRVRTRESVILSLNDPELTKYPVAYMSEPGFWTPNDAEVAGLRAYLLKGGFIIFDDFRGRDWFNLEQRMSQVLPELRFVQIDATHPIFDSFYRITNPEVMNAYDAVPTYWAIFEENDPRKRMLAIANRDNDMSEYWEWSGNGFFAVDITNEAYKIGINYIIYALSR